MKSEPIFDATEYQSQLDLKIQRFNEDFREFAINNIEVFTSPIKHFRMRTEFRIWHTGEKTDYIMFDKDNKKPYEVYEFPIGSITINQLMPQLIAAINQSSLLKHKLYQVDFLTTRAGDALISLIYHKHLNEDWTNEAKKIKSQLNIDIVGRSKGQRLVVDKDYVVEKFTVNNQDYYYQQVEASFTQPNAAICESMLNWAASKSVNFGNDLLELYCGNGNFTLPLSKNFNKVLATEISTSSVNSALFNIEHNKIDNIKIARMSSEEFTQALDGTREFYRLKDVNLKDYNFSTIFVDPPRAGLDQKTLEVAQRFDNIIYISCNPVTLRENLQQLTQTHSIQSFALFDQFPYTHHLECGVILKRI